MFRGLTTVARVFDRAPMTNAFHGPNFALVPAVKTVFNLSNTPYVIDGLTVSTNPGLIPSHSPFTPSSLIISLATAKNEPSFPLARVTPASFSSSVRGRAFVALNCWRVAITETGMVNIWARAPATAPRTSSMAVERAGGFELAGAERVARRM